MNELREKYSPNTYFLNKTRSVYISLDYDKLRIQTTSVEIPRRAICNEILPKPKFIEQRIYDLKDCEVSILPKELVRKRYWSKKYPICLKNVKLLSKTSTTDTPIDNITPTDCDEKLLPENHLILIARCDREKEEWFNLFRKASKNELPSSNDYMKPSTTTTASTTSSTPPPVLKKAESGKTDNLSFTYEASNETVSLKNNIEATSKLNNELIVQNYEKTLKFLNAFLLRTFADFFTHQQWIEKIKTKIQRKINTIKVPYFIEEITIMDIDLGMTVPLIKYANDPWSDEKGLWVHLDIDYNGGFKMSLATKLNLMSLKKFNGEFIENKIHTLIRTRHLGMLNSDEEDSPESSGDESTVNDDEKVER